MIHGHEALALRHPRLVEFHKFFSEFQFWLEAGSNRFRMAVRIYETDDGRFFFVQSHFLRTPVDADPQLMKARAHQTAQEALMTAVENVTTYYDRAVAAGHDPSSDWFIPNDGF